MRAAGAKVLASRKELFPTISLAGAYGYLSGFYKNWTIPESRNWNVSPFGSLPIFHGGEIWANIDAQTSFQRQAVYNYEKSVLTALKDVEDALVGYFKTKARIDELTKKYNANVAASELAKALYFAGVVDFLYVNDVDRDLFITHNTLAESEGNLVTYLIAIYKALGGGW